MINIFGKSASPHGQSRVCQYAFCKNDIVWVCRTCQVVETCALFHDSFCHSNHKGHDISLGIFLHPEWLVSSSVMKLLDTGGRIATPTNLGGNGSHDWRKQCMGSDLCGWLADLHTRSCLWIDNANIDAIEDWSRERGITLYFFPTWLGWKKSLKPPRHMNLSLFSR